MKNLIKGLLDTLGYAMVKVRKDPRAVFHEIKEKEFWDIYDVCKPYTISSVERMYSLYGAVKYIIDNNIEGDFVECGVWRGGSAMIIAKMLFNNRITSRKIFLYDTYEGMSEPTEADKDHFGRNAADRLSKASKDDQHSIWTRVPYDEVKENLSKTGISPGNVVMVKGKVEDTIPGTMPEHKIALLRLDTDWYESTLHELNYLYPLLNVNGVLFIDDYGYWQGCRKAVDEYFQKEKINMLLNRIDYTGRLGIKNC